LQGKPGAGATTVGAEVVGYYPTAQSYGASRDPFVGYVRNFQFAYSFPFGDPGRLDDALPPLVNLFASGTDLVPAPSNLAELQTRALASLLPLIKAELSLPNFILELKDLRSSVKVIKTVLTSSALIGTLKSLLIPKDVSLGGLIRTLAEHHLNLQFNLLPLISDIGKILLALRRTESRMNEFVTRAGRVQTRHFRFAWPEFTDEESSFTFTGTIGGEILKWGINEIGCSRKVSYDATIFHAQVQYNYNYTGYQVEHARLLSYLDAFGINLNPAIIWNAIPWTFVVDWVLGIGQYLDTLKVTNMEPQINIRRYLWSVIRKRRIVVTTAIRNAYDDTAEYRTTLPIVEQTAYRRQVDSVPTSSITSSGLSLRETSLGAALVIARRR
jgi:hypothetical protein